MPSVIGVIQSVEEIDGEEVVTTLDGYHVNSPALVDEWADYLVSPATPMRVYWGSPTFCYRFDSELNYLENVISEG